jgi:hypothetical protein
LLEPVFVRARAHIHKFAQLGYNLFFVGYSLLPQELDKGVGIF